MPLCIFKCSFIHVRYFVQYERIVRKNNEQVLNAI